MLKRVCVAVKMLMLFCRDRNTWLIVYVCSSGLLDIAINLSKRNAAKEIRVERHIYHSGDSEYKMNDKDSVCIDVHDLLLFFVNVFAV